MTTVYASFAGISASKVTTNSGVDLNQLVTVPTIEPLPDYLVRHCADNGLSLKHARQLFCGASDRKSVFELELAEFVAYVRQAKLWNKLNSDVRQNCLDNMQNEVWLKGTKENRGKILFSKIVEKQKYKFIVQRTQGKGTAKEPKNARNYRKAFPKLLKGSQSHLKVQSDYRDALDAVQETFLYWCRSATGKQGFPRDSREDDKLVILAERGSISHMSFGMSRFAIMKDSRKHSSKVSRVSYRDRLGQNAKVLNYRDILLSHCQNVIESSDNKKRKEDAYVTYCKILQSKLFGETDKQIALNLGINTVTVWRIWNKFQAIISARVTLLVDYQSRLESKAIRETVGATNIESGLVITSNEPIATEDWRTIPLPPMNYDSKGILGDTVTAIRDDGTIPQNDEDSVALEPLPKPVISHRIGRGRFAWGWTTNNKMNGSVAPLVLTPIVNASPIGILQTDSVGNWETKALTASSYGYGDDLEDQQYGNTEPKRENINWNVQTGRPVVSRINSTVPPMVANDWSDTTLGTALSSYKEPIGTELARWEAKRNK